MLYWKGISVSMYSTYLSTFLSFCFVHIYTVFVCTMCSIRSKLILVQVYIIQGNLYFSPSIEINWHAKERINNTVMHAQSFCTHYLFLCPFFTFLVWYLFLGFTNPLRLLFSLSSFPILPLLLHILFEEQNNAIVCLVESCSKSSVVFSF